MGFLSTSIGRKIVMSITGLFLISFILVHLGVNLLTLVGRDTFNEAAHFMATNPLIQTMQYVLALGFIIHIGQGINLSLKNNKARPIPYAMNKPSASSSLSSRSMLVTGVLVLLFLILHMKDYFWELKFDDMNGYATDYDLVVALFKNPLYSALYVFSFILLGIHLNHGFQSAFQSVGANHSKYTPMLKMAGSIFSIIVAVGFSAIAIYFSFN